MNELPTDRFTVTPLLPAINAQGPFYVLALDQDEIRLYKGTALTLEHVETEGLELAAWSTMPRPRAPQLPGFLTDRGGHGARAVFHGVDRESDERKARTLQHFRGTDRALRSVLQPAGAPLVLAGVGHLQALYRAVNTYPRLLERGIDGSPEHLHERHFHRDAWAIAGPALQRHRADAIQGCHDPRGTIAPESEMPHASTAAAVVRYRPVE